MELLRMLIECSGILTKAEISFTRTSGSLRVI